ncbi:UPF0125 protein RatB [Serratia symbiotica]|nr:UPF0125 protein RatB [Serratia symbiotica]
MLKKIKVEVIYALPDYQYRRLFKIDIGSNVEETIQKSGLLDLDLNIDLNVNKFGIYGKLVKLNNIVNNGDRIEIYRPLISNYKKKFYKNNK